MQLSRSVSVCVLVIVYITPTNDVAAQSRRPVSTVQVGAPCVAGKVASDDAGRALTCVTMPTGRRWGLGGPIDIAVPAPATWSEVTVDDSGPNAVAPSPALPGLYVNRAAMETRLIELTNSLRAAKGIEPLVVDPRLTRLARWWADKSDDPSTAGRGTTHCPADICTTRALEIGHASFGEVIRPSSWFPGGDMADKQFFVNSPAHVAILADARYTHIGYGLHIDALPGGGTQGMGNIIVVAQLGRSRQR